MSRSNLTSPCSGLMLRLIILFYLWTVYADLSGGRSFEPSAEQVA